MSYSDTSDSSEWEPTEISQCLFQSGRQEVGSKDEDGEESMRIRVDFAWAFPGTPAIVCCAEGEKGTDYGDTFSVTVVNPSEHGFEANIGRQHLENQGWGQCVQLNWFAVLRRETEIIQADTAHVGDNNDDEQTKVVKVKFRPAFPKNSKPCIMATALGEDYPDAFSCSVRRVTRKSAEIVVARTNQHHRSWGQNLQVNWVATTCFPSMRLHLGSFDGDDDSRKEWIEYPGKYKKVPTVFVVPQHEEGSEYPDCMCATVTNCTKEGFQLNVARVHESERGWGQNLRGYCVIIP
jgi:hypothetical protein